MKRKNTTEVSNNQIIEYLTEAAAHAGYMFDGVKIESGTAVTCLKTIATATGLSYYRVKKCVAQLVESGRATITRHKGFAIITFCSTATDDVQAESCPKAETPATKSMSTVSARRSTQDVQIVQTSQTQSATMPPQVSATPILNRAARRCLARQTAKEAKAAARRLR